MNKVCNGWSEITTTPFLIYLVKMGFECVLGETMIESSGHPLICTSFRNLKPSHWRASRTFLASSLWFHCFHFLILKVEKSLALPPSFFASWKLDSHVYLWRLCLPHLFRNSMMLNTCNWSLFWGLLKFMQRRFIREKFPISLRLSVSWKILYSYIWDRLRVIHPK